MLFGLSAPVGWLSWMAGLASAAIEKIVIERINGRARTASSDFFIGLTSRKAFCDMVRGPELLRTFQTLERGAKLLFLAAGTGACQPILQRVQSCRDHWQLPNCARLGRARAPVPTQPTLG